MTNTNRYVAEKMLEAINNRQFHLFDQIMAESFIDHHRLGEGINSRNDYVNALKYFIEALNVSAQLDLVFSKEAYTVVYGKMFGKHSAEFLGVSPTGNTFEWTFIEVYRLEHGMIKERWSIDDTISILKGIGIDLFH